MGRKCLPLSEWTFLTSLATSTVLLCFPPRDCQVFTWKLFMSHLSAQQSLKGNFRGQNPHFRGPAPPLTAHGADFMNH